MKRLLGKRVVVTGGSNGIGRAIVEAFAKEGADVLFTMHSDKEAATDVQKACYEFGTKVDFVAMDAGDPASAKDLLEKAIDFHSQIDVVVNNVAVITRTGFLDITAEQYQWVMDVNLRFPFFTTQLFAKHMKENNIRGSIINISSVSAFKAISQMAHYQCSKAALSMLSNSAAYELGSAGIRVNTISPGLTATKANQNQWRDDPKLWKERSKDIPMARVGVPTDHAGAAVFLASDESSWITGADLVIDGGYAVI